MQGFIHLHDAGERKIVARARVATGWINHREHRAHRDHRESHLGIITGRAALGRGAS
jgi:hypothetical protein